VGKSSLVNLITGRKSLAHVSQTPGKTRRLHFYLLPGNRYLVDWPGFGYAAVSQSQRKEMETAIRLHAERTPALRGVVYLLDMRIESTKVDADALSWLLGTGVPVLLVGSKADQVPKAKRQAVLQALARRYGAELPPLALSTRTGDGRDALWEQMGLMWDASGETSPHSGE
jgi:GTP-binding protein